AVAEAPTHGTLQGTAPRLAYEPDAGIAGTDSFTFTVDDGHGGTATGTVTVTVERHGRSNAHDRPNGHVSNGHGQSNGHDRSNGHGRSLTAMLSPHGHHPRWFS